MTTPGVPVYLNVYKLESFQAYETYLKYLFLGAYHSGIQVYGEEISFGYHPQETTGIFKIEPKTAPGCIFLETVLLGRTMCSYDEIQGVLDNLGRSWKGLSYNIFTRNCNNFTSELSQILCAVPIPSYVNRLATVGRLFQCVLPLDSTGAPSSAPTPAAAEEFTPFTGPGYALSSSGETRRDEDNEARRRLLADRAQQRLTKQWSEGPLL